MTPRCHIKVGIMNGEIKKRKDTNQKKNGGIFNECMFMAWRKSNDERVS